jgi:hypothetical protein
MLKKIVLFLVGIFSVIFFVILTVRLSPTGEDSSPALHEPLNKEIEEIKKREDFQLKVENQAKQILLQEKKTSLQADLELIEHELQQLRSVELSFQ